MPEISDDDLGHLVWCAMDYGRRLPEGRVPGRIWELLNSEWRGKINHLRSADTDALGAQICAREG